RWRVNTARPSFAVAAALRSPANAATSPSFSISPGTWIRLARLISLAATHDRCPLGGMIGNNSCGVHSVMAGKTDDNIEELEILTYDGMRMKVGQTGDAELEKIIGQKGRRGEIYAGLIRLRDAYSDLIRKRYPKIPRRVSGYNLNYLLPENGLHVARALVGSEGTCATRLEATCRLGESPPERVLLVVG